MSLRIDIDKVTAVLLADGWHTVDDASFDCDAYEFMSGDGELVHGGGQSGVCATGFGFNSEDARIYGPLTAILAVKESR